MSKEATLSYQQAAARGASPIGEIVALYDTILRDFGRALIALKSRDIEARVFELNHAIAVIGHLQSVLDHDRGGEPAKHFERFYNITRAMIVQANAKATPESLEELIALYGSVRQAWHQLDQRLPFDPHPAPLISQPEKPTGTNASSPAKEDAETPQLQWSA
jgi:flagellar protein FliS